MSTMWEIQVSLPWEAGLKTTPSWGNALLIKRPLRGVYSYVLEISLMR